MLVTKATPPGMRREERVRKNVVRGKCSRTSVEMREENFLGSERRIGGFSGFEGLRKLWS